MFSLSFTVINSKNMETTLIQQNEQLPKEEVEDYEEKLPDGTIHHTHKVRKLSITKIITTRTTEDGNVIEEEEEKKVPVSEDIMETFEEPAQLQIDEEEVDQELKDGTKVHKKLITKRMVHHIRTHQESYDTDHGRKVEESEFDEVVPGTEYTFVTGENDSDSEEEISQQLTSTSISSEDHRTGNILLGVVADFTRGSFTS